MGLSFPFPQELNDLLCTFSFIPAQLSPNSYPIFNGVLSSFRENEIPWSVDQFMSFVIVRSFHGVCFFQSHTNFPVTTRHLHSSHKGWKDGYFFVVSKSIYPFCTTLDFPPQAVFNNMGSSDELDAYMRAWDPNTTIILDYSKVDYFNRFPSLNLVTKGSPKLITKTSASDSTTLAEVVEKLKKKRHLKRDPEVEPPVVRKRLMKEMAHKVNVDIQAGNIHVLAFYEPDGTLPSDSDLDEPLDISRVEYYIGATNILSHFLSFDAGISGVVEEEKETTLVRGILFEVVVSALNEPSSPQPHEMDLSPLRAEEILQSPSGSALAPTALETAIVASARKADILGCMPNDPATGRVVESMC